MRILLKSEGIDCITSRCGSVDGGSWRVEDVYPCRSGQPHRSHLSRPCESELSASRYHGKGALTRVEIKFPVGQSAAHVTGREAACQEGARPALVLECRDLVIGEVWR